ncbi:MAG: hypothetical protein AB7Y46_13715 [Armatimonadota bacterium]
MLGDPAKCVAERLLAPVNRRLARAGASPVLAHLGEVAMAAATGALLARRRPRAAIATFVAHCWCDYLDGALRRTGEATVRQAPLPADLAHALSDKLAEALIFAGAALGRLVSWPLAVLALIASCLSTITGFALQRKGIPRDHAIFDRTDRMGALLTGLLAGSVGPALLAACAMGLLVILQRLFAPASRT